MALIQERSPCCIGVSPYNLPHNQKHHPAEGHSDCSTCPDLIEKELAYPDLRYQTEHIFLHLSQAPGIKRQA